MTKLIKLTRKMYNRTEFKLQLTAWEMNQKKEKYSIEINYVPKQNIKVSIAIKCFIFISTEPIVLLNCYGC